MYPQVKSVLALVPTSGTNGATVTATLDTLGYDFLSLDLVQTTSDAATNNLSICKLAECDTSNGTFSDVSGTVGDTDWTIPNAQTTTTTPDIYKFNVDLRHRKRFLKLSASPLTTVTFYAIGQLMRGEQTPNSATKAGVAALIGV